MNTPNNIPPSSHGMTGWRKRLADRREARLAKEAAVADRHAARLARNQVIRDYREAKANGTLPPVTPPTEIGDVGGYDLNGNPL